MISKAVNKITRLHVGALSTVILRDFIFEFKRNKYIDSVYFTETWRYFLLTVKQFPASKTLRYINYYYYSTMHMEQYKILNVSGKCNKSKVWMTKCVAHIKTGCFEWKKNLFCMNEFLFRNSWSQIFISLEQILFPRNEI